MYIIIWLTLKQELLNIRQCFFEGVLITKCTYRYRRHRHPSRGHNLPHLTNLWHTLIRHSRFHSNQHPTTILAHLHNQSMIQGLPFQSRPCIIVKLNNHIEELSTETYLYTLVELGIRYSHPSFLLK